MTDRELRPGEGADVNEQVMIRREKAEKIAALGIDPYGKRFVTDAAIADITGGFADYEGRTVTVAGRIVAEREHGRARFYNLQDGSGRIQIYCRQDRLGEQGYALLSLVDIGDFIGVSGEVFRTQKGEISIRAQSVEFLTKSLRPLPEKWHGLRDVEMRYRQRYVDLIVNDDVRRTFRLRSRIISLLRSKLEQRGFLEVQTPVLCPVAGGAAARPFVTRHNALDMTMYLRIAPELYLKRLVVGGLEKVFEIGKMFRNEGVSTKHNPEFTMMELYWAYADYNDVMALTEQLFAEIAIDLFNTTVISYQGQTIDLAPPWPRITMAEAISRYSSYDWSEVRTIGQARNVADAVGAAYSPADGMGSLLSAVFEAVAEPHLQRPTFVTHHPTEISPLARRNRDNPEITDRFEAFIGGREYANGFSELNDPADQRQRFEQQAAQREAGNDEAHMMDHDYITALEYGLPPTGGLGIGVDRLVMLLTDSPSIRDVILFPHMRAAGR
ncbi:MAG: lysine--tRNA ligase [Negativicutes bacterium]|nr:lysine--tRNA ligase [Negativicutes bacterium]